MVGAIVEAWVDRTVAMGLTISTPAGGVGEATALLHALVNTIAQALMTSQPMCLWWFIEF